MTKNKIVTLDELAAIVEARKQEGKTVVQCHGCFDLMHPGHIRHFEAAKKEGDVLVITVTPDRFVNKGPDRPVYNEALRLESLAALEVVDYVALTRAPDGPAAIRAVRPSVFVKGQDYTQAAATPGSATYEEKLAVEAEGGRLAITYDPVAMSSSKLLNNFFVNYPETTRVFLDGFKKKYDEDAIMGWLEKIRGLKVLVVGDTIVDQYHYCQAVGMSSKEMMMSVKFQEEELFAGGVLAAANNIAGFCDSVDLITCLGARDSFEDFVVRSLAPNVRPTFVRRDDAPTTVIRRYLGKVFLSKMFQVYFTNDSPLPAAAEAALLDQFAARLKSYDAVIVFDYGFGFLTEKAIASLIENSRFLGVNTQTNSMNRGFNPVTKYAGASHICIDEPEIRVATRKKYIPVKELVAGLAEEMNVPRMILTRGHLGSMAYDRASGAFQEIPVLSGNVVDRTGAGDAYFSLTAPLVAVGAPLDLTAFLGNIAGAIAVTIVCNREPVARSKVVSYAKTLLK